MLRGNGATFGIMAKRTELDLTMTSLILLPRAWAARTLPDQVRCQILRRVTGLLSRATTGWKAGAPEPRLRVAMQVAAAVLPMAAILRMETPRALRATVWEMEDCLAVPLPSPVISTKKSRG